MRILDQVEELNRILPDMPLITDNTLKVKHIYGKFPTDIKEYCDYKNYKFLNNAEHLIEEIHYRKPKTIDSFAKYQLMRFSTFDKFYERFQNWQKYNGGDSMVQGGGGGGTRGYFINLGKPIGATLETNSGGSNTDFSKDLLQAFKLSSLGTIGDYYDQAAIEIISNSGGNIRLGVYSDSSGPSTLMGETGSVAVANGYSFQSIPEFALTTTQNWVSHVNSVSPFNPSYASTPTNGRKYRAFSFAAMPTPWGTPDTTDSIVARCKMGHS